ncbi:hypothetical protein [Lichenifustis flavocetrariae]|uniref:hypothetical protein n=1 Tax=Lichenifustis flavocetrariae TaxID=2949735 RepID=UPI0024A761B0|nr:hypothetical protein [Lichenifustis flavocetrariae]
MKAKLDVCRSSMPWLVFKECTWRSVANPHSPAADDVPILIEDGPALEVTSRAVCVGSARSRKPANHTCGNICRVVTAVSPRAIVPALIALIAVVVATPKSLVAIVHRPVIRGVSLVVLRVRGAYKRREHGSDNGDALEHLDDGCHVRPRIARIAREKRRCSVAWLKHVGHPFVPPMT